MGYLETNVISDKEQIKIVPQKNPMFVILWWIWGILGCWLLLIPTIKAIIATVRYCNTEYVVTDKNVYEKYGWISTHTDEMPISKIENIVVNYTFWGKIFNYGEVSIQGTNKNNIDFSYIRNAEATKKQLKELVD